MAVKHAKYLIVISPQGRKWHWEVKGWHNKGEKDYNRFYNVILDGTPSGYYMLSGSQSYYKFGGSRRSAFKAELTARREIAWVEANLSRNVDHSEYVRANTRTYEV